MKNVCLYGCVNDEREREREGGGEVVKMIFELFTVTFVGFVSLIRDGVKPHKF